MFKNIFCYFKFMQCLLICLLRVIDPVMLKRKRQKLSNENLFWQLPSDPSE